MKVEYCRKCEHCEKRRYSTYYVPNNYHAIGMTHVYSFCKKHNKRALAVKKCKEFAEAEG